MIKIIAVLKRKKGTTREEFRQHYEASHAEMAKKYMGHLLVEYRRNYLPELPRLTDPENGLQYDDLGPDVITEICIRDEAAVKEFYEIFGDDNLQKMFVDDEKRFLDRDISRWGIAEVVETDLARLDS